MASPHDPLEAVVEALVRARGDAPAADDQALQSSVATAAQAYEVQERVLRRLGQAAGVPRYWKSGGPSHHDTLTHSPLPEANVRRSGSRFDDLRWRHRWIEAEVALRVGRDVTPDAAQQAADAASAGAFIDAMTVTIEIVDSRWASARQAPALLKLADFQVHGALAVGELVPFAPRDWAQQECRVRIGGGDWQGFRGSLSVVDPCWVLPQWLRHVTRNGATVPAGTLVTAGTWCGLLEAEAGDRVEAEFPGIGSVSVQL